MRQRAARKARNPRTGAEAFVPAKSVVVFKVGKLMRERVSSTPSAPSAPQAMGT
ncbi:MAG TPA: HU family DNA-binding protein [Candidatus Hypogeohydataceae bacterium YC40]